MVIAVMIATMDCGRTVCRCLMMNVTISPALQGGHHAKQPPWFFFPPRSRGLAAGIQNTGSLPDAHSVGERFFVDTERRVL